jgi:phosphate transport system permease protein
MESGTYSRPAFSARSQEKVGFAAVQLISLITVLPIVLVILYIIVRGIPAINLEFLAGFPKEGMRAGGILPAIVGTLYLTLGTAVVSVPLGVAAGIYMSEYAGDTVITRLIRIAMINLSGIPSVVYGLFGLGLLCSSWGLEPASWRLRSPWEL